VEDIASEMPSEHS